MIIKHQCRQQVVIEVVITMWLVVNEVDYNKECKNPRIGGYQWVLGPQSLGPLFIPTPQD